MCTTHRILLSVSLALQCLVSGAQSDLPREAEDALRIGRILHRSEVASWKGTDLLMEQMAHLRSLIGGYFSYAHGDTTTCVFVDRSEEGRAVVRFVFGADPATGTANVDTARHMLTKQEQELLAMRRAAMVLITKTPGFFLVFDKMNLNPIPLIDGKDRLVYVLSGPTETGVMLLGNDYLITLDATNRIRAKQRLHKNLIPIHSTATGDGKVVASMHTHLKSTGDFITATDVCTLMLYGPYTGVDQHIVMSKDKVSIFNCSSGQLVVMDRKAWDRIAKDQSKRSGE